MTYMVFSINLSALTTSIQKSLAYAGLLFLLTLVGKPHLVHRACFDPLNLQRRAYNEWLKKRLRNLAGLFQTSDMDQLPVIKKTVLYGQVSATRTFSPITSVAINIMHPAVMKTPVTPLIPKSKPPNAAPAAIED